MKIGFDSQILFERQKTGIGRNSEAMIEHFIQLNLDDIVLNYFRMFDENNREEVIARYLKNSKVIKRCLY